MKILYPECGKIVGTHGCRGESKIESYCDTPEILAHLPFVYLKKNGEMVKKKLLSPRVHGGGVIATLEGISDMNEAETLRGTVLYAFRGDLPLKADGVLFAELPGLPVTDATSGEMYGTITEAERGVACDYYTVKLLNGKIVVIPAVPEFVKEKDPETGVKIAPIPGLLDDEV